MQPLNGTKTHPLTQHAIEALKDIGKQDTPRSKINPGVVDRLMRGGYVKIVSLPSPFKSNKGKLIDHLRITDTGRIAIKETWPFPYRSPHTK